MAASHPVTAQAREQVKEGRARSERWWIGFNGYIRSSKTTERLQWNEKGTC